MTGCSNGLNSGEDSWRSGMVGIVVPRSAAVMTACTPARERAAPASIERMRPCATALRRITACRRLSRARSSTNWPRPRRKRRSSMRSTGLPTKALVVRVWFMRYRFLGNPSLREPHAREFPLRQLLHGVAHAFAAEAARADAPEGIAIEPEAAGIVDPQRADPELARYLERGLEARGEAGALQPELGCVRKLERGVGIGDALHHDDRPERLLTHEARLRRRFCDDCRPEDGAAALRLEHELGALGDGIRDHLLDPVGRGATH